MKKYRPALIFLASTVVLAGAILIISYFFSANKNSSATDTASEEQPRLFDESVGNEDTLENNSVTQVFLDNSLNQSRPLNLLFFGDMMLDRHVGERLEGRHMGYLLDGLAGEEKYFFTGFDIISANLEGAVTDGGAHYAPVNAYDFAFSPERIAELKDYGFNYFALANNHFSDQGERGVIETRKNLSELGFYFSGAPDARIDENTRQDIEVAGQKIAMISLSMVYNNFDLENAKSLIEQAAIETDLTIINIHWGNEYQHQFNRYQQNVGHALVEAGADMIIGHHPHVVQGVEIYQGKPIFYSLGNFIFDQYFSAATQESLALKITVDSEQIIISLLPLRSERSVPRQMSDKEKEVFLKSFSAWSRTSETLVEEIENQRIIIKR